MYVILWQFKAKPSLKKKFEMSYASNGPWTDLFQKSAGYLGTELLQQPDQGSTYLTIDSWNTKQEYQQFMMAYKTHYERLDTRLEELTESEAFLGEYTSSEEGAKTAPVIETERLILRPHRFEDFKACYAMWADPVVTRFIGGKPASEQQTWARLLSYIGHWALMHFGYWAVMEKATQLYIGELGFADFKRELKPSITGIPEVGWALASHAHGKGYATEALQAVVAWGDANLNASQTVCIIDPANRQSIHVAQKLAYQEHERTTYREEPVILFSRKSFIRV